jgi:hypothetical protein
MSLLRENPYLVTLLLCLPVGAIYFYCAVLITHNIFAPTDTAYYNYLLDAFFHGHTNVTNTPGQLDLSLFENKWYLYWGPAPALLVLPFYLIWHVQASDVLYTAIGGTINVALFSLAMQEFKKHFHLSLSLMAEAFLVLSFGLASPSFFLATAGTIWHTNQTFAATYLLLFYVLYFRFLNNNKHYQLILCVVFFCLACLSRYTLVFNSILFLYLFLESKRSGRTIPTKLILSLALLILAFVCLEVLYNFVRFHHLLETGQQFQQGDIDSAILKTNHLLSPRYIPQNLYYCFLNLVHFSPVDLFVGLDLYGNSVFSVYPALLLVPVLFCKRKDGDKQRMSFLPLAGIAIGLNILALMLYLASGYAQFGYRYFFDVLPLLFLLLLFILPSIPMLIQMGLLAYGIFVNFYGTMVFRSLFGFVDVPSLGETLFWIVMIISLLPFLSTEILERNLPNREIIPKGEKHSSSSLE